MTLESDNKTTRKSIFAIPLTKLVVFVLSHKTAVIFMALIFAGVSLYFSSNHLKFKNRRLDLINPNSDWNQYWKEYITKFGSDDDLIVVVDGKTPGKEKEEVIQALDIIAAKLEKRPDLFYSIFYKVDDKKLVEKGLHYSSESNLKGLCLFLQSTQGVLQNRWEDISLHRLMNMSFQPLMAPEGTLSKTEREEAEKFLYRMIHSLEGIFATNYQFISPWPVLDDVESRRQVQTTSLDETMKPENSHQAGMFFLPGVPTNKSSFAERVFIAEARPEEEIKHEKSSSGNNSPSFAGEILPFGAYMARYPDTCPVGQPCCDSAPEFGYQQQDFPEFIEAFPAENHFPPSPGMSEMAPASSVGTGYSQNTPFQEISSQENAPSAAQVNHTGNAAINAPTGNLPSEMPRQNIPNSAGFPTFSSEMLTSSELPENQNISENLGLPENTNIPAYTQLKNETAKNQTPHFQMLTKDTVNSPSMPAQKSEVTVTDAASSSSNIHYFWLNRDKCKTAILMVKLVDREKDSFARGTEGIDCIRNILSEVNKEIPGTELQLTGLPVMENDEMRTSERDMSKATILAAFGILILYMLFFGGLKHPIMAMIALGFGIAWSMGYITLAVGNLNILSISFGLILVGLGIDFGIHLTNRYVACRRMGDDTRQALIRATYEVGPGILTGGITTSVAFAMAGFTEFTGVAELGIVAGGGIILCCLAAFLILPILIYLGDKNTPAEKLPRGKNPNELLAVFQFHPMITLGMVAALIVCFGYGSKYLYYDYNLLNLQEDNLESVKLEKRLLDESKQSVWYALSMSDNREELLKRYDQLIKLPSVERVEQIIKCVPEENPRRTAMIQQIHQTLQHIPDHVQPIFDLAQIRRIQSKSELGERLNLAAVEQSFLQMLTFLNSKSEYAELYSRVKTVFANFRSMDARPSEIPVNTSGASPSYADRIAAYHQSLGEDLLKKMKTIYSMSNPESPQYSDLPKSFVERFMAPDGTHLLKIFGKGELWDMDTLSQFVKEVKEVDPHATGNPIQTYYCSHQMKDCYIKAAFFALAAVIFFLYIDLRSIRQTFLALFPVGLGMLQTFGIMGYLGIPLNVANMIVLPLIIGIGIDDGIHVLHDFRQQHEKKFYRLSSSTCTSIILTSLTTIIGFGTLALASHKGLQSLGLVLSLGIFCCLYTSILILPALLTIFCRFAEEGYRVESREDENQRLSKDLGHSTFSSGEKVFMPGNSDARPAFHAEFTHSPQAKEKPADAQKNLGRDTSGDIPHPMNAPAKMSPTLSDSARKNNSTQERPSPFVPSSTEPAMRISRYITTPTGEVVHTTTTCASPLISSLLPDNRAA
ncbi:MAG: MMPL family transporter [Planctomycetia bacterium]|nr:MMPL family transporter [Planctomycetia bacterium]